MENKLNHTVIKEYSIAFTEKVCENFFRDHIKIDGKQILNLCPVKQINLFVINSLFEAWQLEMQKLKSPFFDYEDDEVKEALEEFLNILSRHISIGEEDFKPLLQKAVLDTVLLIFSPYHYYVEVFNSPDRYEITLDELESSSKFIKINKPILDALINHLKINYLDRIFGDRKKQTLDEVFESLEAAPEDFDEYVKQLSTIEPLDADQIYIKEGEEVQPDDVEESNNYIVEKIPEPEFTDSEEGDDDKEEEVKTLNDRFKNSVVGTLADLHQKKRIEDIKKHLNINQRYMFTKTLFGDSAKEFDAAIASLDNYSSYVDAFNYLRRDYATKYRWKMDSEEVIEFLEIISKKYL